MANEKTPVVWDDSTKKHRPLGQGEKMGGLSASSLLSSDSGNLITTGSDGLAFLSGSGIADPAADNLIETSAQGKLKVDMDRIVEWLDGHPQDAKDIADAIHVVSGDSGNLIHEGSDKGAFLSNAQLAAAIAGLTDAQRQALAAELADGTTITASGGKLHAAEQKGDADYLADGTTITASGGKLHVSPSALADGQTIVASGGKLKVNYGAGLKYNSSTGKLEVVFQDLTVDQLLALCDPNGGISANNKGLYVDFSKMDMSSFQELVDSLHVPFWVGETVGGERIGTEFYVNNYREAITEPEYTRHAYGGYVKQVSGQNVWFRFRDEGTDLQYDEWQSAGWVVEQVGTGDNAVYYRYRNSGSSTAERQTGQTLVGNADAELRRQNLGGCATRTMYYVRSVSSELVRFDLRYTVTQAEATTFASDGWFTDSKTDEDTGVTTWYRYRNRGKSLEAQKAGIEPPSGITEAGNYYDYYWYLGNNVEVDSTDGTRYGRSEEHPWRTIAFATQTLCKNYNISSNTVHINVRGHAVTAAGKTIALEYPGETYTEAVALPLQQRTTGAIVIRPNTHFETVGTGNNAVTTEVRDIVDVEYATTAGGSAFSHTGGSWYLDDMNIKLVVNPQTSASATFPHILTSSDSSGSVRLRHDNLSFEDNTAPSLSTGPAVLRRGSVDIRLIHGSAGSISISNHNTNVINGNGEKEPVVSEYESTWSGIKGNASVRWFYLENGTTLIMTRTDNTDPRGYVYHVSGRFSYFCHALQDSLYRTLGTGTDPIWEYTAGDPENYVDGTCTGIRWALTSGAHITTSAANGAAATVYFPGHAAGSTDSHSWMSPTPE